MVSNAEENFEPQEKLLLHLLLIFLALNREKIYGMAFFVGPKTPESQVQLVAKKAFSDYSYVQLLATTSWTFFVRVHSSILRPSAVIKLLLPQCRKAPLMSSNDPHDVIPWTTSKTKLTLNLSASNC